MWAVHKAYLYLAGADFELVVDHRRLIFILNSKSPDELPSPHLVRLKEKLALYQMTAVWRPGIEHKIVDCFSRYPVDDPTLTMRKLPLRRLRTYTRWCFKPREITPPMIGFWRFLRIPISRVSKQRRIRTLDTKTFSPQPSMSSLPTSADSMAPSDLSSPFITTYGLPTGLSCEAHAWYFPHDSGRRSSASCTPVMKTNTALYARPDRWSIGHPSQTIFAMWSVAARRAQNAFPPTP